MLKVLDIADPNRVSKIPDGSVTLLSGKFKEGEFTIQNIELRLFTEGVDSKLGTYSLLTILVQTDKGDVESVYDEGYRGEGILDRTANFILNNLGLSGIIVRSTITLREEIERQGN